LLSPAFAPDRFQRAPRTQVVMPGGRGPEPPGASGYEPPPQDATPRSAFRIVSRRRPSMSEAATFLAQTLYVVKIYIQNVADGRCRQQPRDPDVGAPQRMRASAESTPARPRLNPCGGGG